MLLFKISKWCGFCFVLFIICDSVGTLWKVLKLMTLAKNYRLCVLIATRQYLLGTTDTNLFIGIVSWLPGILWAMLSSDVNQVKHVWDMMRVLSRFIHVLKLDWLRGTVATRSTNVNPSCRIHKSSCSPIYQVQFSYEEPRTLLGLIYQGNEFSYSQSLCYVTSQIETLHVIR